MASIADLYLPFDAGPGAGVTEDNWRKMARHWIGSGPLWAEDFGLLPYGDSSGMQVKVKTGKAFVRGHYAEFTAEKILPIAAVGGIPGGQSRLDSVVIRADFVNNRVEVDVVAGVAAATGTQVAPAVVQSAAVWEIQIGTVGPLTNATATIAAGTVTDTRLMIVPGGLGTIINPTVVVGSGGTAPAFAGTWASGVEPVSFYFDSSTRTVHIQGIATNPVNPPANSAIFTLPAGYRPAAQKFLPVVFGVGTAGALVKVDAAGVVSVVNDLAAGDNVYLNAIHFRVL